MHYTTEDIGKIIREVRKQFGITQKELALTSGTGLRFIIDLEKGKASCQTGKMLTVLQTLGIKMNIILPKPIKNEK